MGAHVCVCCYLTRQVSLCNEHVGPLCRKSQCCEECDRTNCARQSEMKRALVDTVCHLMFSHYFPISLLPW